MISVFNENCFQTISGFIHARSVPLRRVQKKKMSNPDSHDRQESERELLQENLAMREQNVAMQEQNRAIRENDSAATGLMLGVLLLGLAVLGFGVYFMTQRPVATPTRTIIERDRTTTAPAQPAAPPNVNVTVPSAAPPNVNIAIPQATPSAVPSTEPTAVPTAAPSSASPQAAPANP